MALVRLIYVSRATDPVTEVMLNSIRDNADRHNCELDITGVLFAGGGRFIQVLEGDAIHVMLLYERIRSDKRHRDVQCIDFDYVPFRVFCNWNMGVFNVDELPAVSEFDIAIIREAIERIRFDASVAAARRHLITALDNFRVQIDGDGFSETAA